MRIDHVIFLIHPCCYEGLDDATVERDNLYFYVDLEKQVKARWLEALAARPPNTLLLQLGGPEELRDKVAEFLGENAVFYPRTAFPENGGLAEYYRRLAADFWGHVEGRGLALDPALVSAELWGESFEGCVPGYGGAFAQYLGLRQAPRLRFAMTVYDSRFLCGARHWETIPLAGCDVEAWLFECHDGSGAAMFQARRTAQWIDGRRVHIDLDDKRVQVSTKGGHTLWPETPWEKGQSEVVRPYSMTLQECNWRWLRAPGLSWAAFRAVVRGARVTEAEEETSNGERSA